VRLAAIALASALLLSTAGAFDTEAVRFMPRLAYGWRWRRSAWPHSSCLHQRLVRFVPQGPHFLLRVIGWSILALPLNMVAVLSCKLLFGGSPSLGGFLLLLPGMASILAALQFAVATFARLQPAPVPAPADATPPPGLRVGLPYPAVGAHHRAGSAGPLCSGPHDGGRCLGRAPGSVMRSSL
jgi:hypothetical protein